MMMSSVLESYTAFDERGENLAGSPALRSAAEWLARELGDEPLVLLARTDAALMICAATAMVRTAQTRVVRATLGREEWSAPQGAVLVEPVAPLPGLLANLQELLPGTKIVVLPGLPDTDQAATGTVRELVAA
jgi:hypothetical protein